VRRDRHLRIRLTEHELTAMREAAEREGLSVSALLRRCFAEWLEVAEINRRNDAQARRQAARLHRLPPHVARELLSRGVDESDWPPDTEGDTRT
jgi:hypothetical protein